MRLRPPRSARGALVADFVYSLAAEPGRHRASQARAEPVGDPREAPAPTDDAEASRVDDDVDALPAKPEALIEAAVLRLACAGTRTPNCERRAGPVTASVNRPASPTSIASGLWSRASNHVRARKTPAERGGKQMRPRPRDEPRHGAAASRSCSSRAGPIPGMASRSSTEVNAPCFSR